MLCLVCDQPFIQALETFANLYVVVHIEVGVHHKMCSQ